VELSLVKKKFNFNFSMSI